MKRKVLIKRFSVFRIVVIYAVFGSLWIYLSDSLLALLFRDPKIITRLAMFKGLMFISLTALLLYFLIKRYTVTLSESNKRLEASMETLRRSEQELKSVLELMPVGISWSNDDGEIEYMNRYFIERFGYLHSEIPTVAEWFLLAYPDPSYRYSLVSKWYSNIEEANKSGAPVPSFESRVTCKNGMVRHTIVNTWIVPGRTLVIFTDITEEEGRREEAIKAQKLESLGILAGGIAHDFNNILTAILGNISYAELFLEDGHKAASALREAERASERAAELARQLLTFARGGEPLVTDVSAARLVEESVSLVLRGSNVKSLLRLTDDLPPLKADAGQISQVFNNLVINAVQAMPEGGTITVTAEKVELPPHNRLDLPTGGYLLISFKDEGCGIPPENQKKVFDPYFTTKSHGSGLGLASAHSVISRHGGYIELSSVLGEGTTFNIYLPVSDSSLPENDDVPCKPATDIPHDLSILVMDDEDTICELMRRMLATVGCRAAICRDGAEAISLYRSALDAGTPYFAVIMDITIPGGMGGIEAAQRILELDPGARLIVSSGYSNDSALADFRNYGFCDAMTKPYKVTELANALQRLTLISASR